MCWHWEGQPVVLRWWLSNHQPTPHPWPEPEAHWRRGLGRDLVKGSMINHILFKRAFQWAHYGGFLSWTSISFFLSFLMLLPGFGLTVLFSPVVDMQSLLVLPDCLCILPVLFRHEILPDTCPSKQRWCFQVAMLWDVACGSQAEAIRASSRCHLVLFPLAEMVTKLWAGWSPQVEGACAPPSSRGQPPQPCGLSQETETALCLTEANVSFEPLYISWALF